MTPPARIAFATDIHIGWNESTWGQQPRWTGSQQEFFAVLGEYLSVKDVQLLILGGDLCDHGTEEEIDRFFALIADLPLPVLPILGNHDLLQPDSWGSWQKRWASHPKAIPANTKASLGGWDLIAFNHPWAGRDGMSFHWDSNLPGPLPAIGHEELAFLDKTLSECTDRPAAIFTHAPLDPLPPALTGLPVATHIEPQEFTGPIVELLDRHPRVRLFFAGHNHVNCATSHGTWVHLTTSALSEVPFALRIVDLHPQSASVETFHLPMEGPGVPLPEPSRLWALGRPEDTSIRLEWE